MPNLLSRNPFHHQDQGSKSMGTGGQHSSPGKGSSPSGGATVTRNSRSFLNFMNRRQSNDSVRSERSTDSLQTTSTPSHNVSPHGNPHESTMATTTSPKPSHSMAELKRFFRPNLHRKNTGAGGHGPQRSSSTINLNLPFTHHQTGHSKHQVPAQGHHRQHQQHQPHSHSEHHVHTQSAIPPSSDSTLSLSNNINIYHDDAILAQKYGKLGKLLGAGAGGSVKVLVRPTDGATFAVKEFRPRKANESVNDYAKKCTAEFCIGSTLRHPNIIETLDIFSDSKQNKYYEVMEYCPIDFFAVVMTGKMSRGEINCCLRQLTEGVEYLHSMGLAHRDLKLDNCVMTSEGILKLIDFGSAVVFRYPMETEVAMAHGVVGSDPYLAPEVLTSTKSYDPQCVDVWSIGIIYCCMMLKRFPWKAPRESDENFRLYCLPDDVEHDYVASAKHHEKLLKERRERHGPHEHVHEQQPRNDPVPDGKDVPQEPAEEKTVNKSKVNESGDTECDKRSQDQTSGNPKEDLQPKEPKESNELKDVHPGNSKTEKVETHDLRSVASHKSNGPHHRKVIHGPYRLLRLLPHASRPIMSRILEVDPRKRATLADMYKDDWFRNIPFCTMDPKKQVIRAPGHHHTLVKEEDAHLETYKV
ncbi:hypothetical protein HG536_0A08170 [Torulaspora globosa]|uniref:non-specific serine/threonine protein kinase n=1 Tax=Torulaspora globosa TaxID=48254 RepID=A0A7G3ZBW6_9SACH|nr:uncharacterized protein HG536_0A08170 [Torulaspora globosa]QLL31002.1 hypothetical protein HG536_0A08170 [Torulaspora globosa]